MYYNNRDHRDQDPNMHMDFKGRVDHFRSEPNYFDFDNAPEEYLADDRHHLKVRKKQINYARDEYE